MSFQKLAASELQHSCTLRILEVMQGDQTEYDANIIWMNTGMKQYLTSFLHENAQQWRYAGRRKEKYPRTRKRKIGKNEIEGAKRARCESGLGYRLFSAPAKAAYLLSLQGRNLNFAMRAPLRAVCALRRDLELEGSLCRAFFLPCACTQPDEECALLFLPY